MTQTLTAYNFGPTTWRERLQERYEDFLIGGLNLYFDIIGIPQPTITELPDTLVLEDETAEPLNG